MAIFKIKGFALDYHEEDIEAETLEQAQEKFKQKLENGETEPSETNLYFEGEEDYNYVEGVLYEDDDIEDNPS